MAYFKNFPQIYYSFSTGLTITAFVMTDILRRVKADDANTLNALSYNAYFVLDGDTPEIVSDKIYGRSDLHWTILIANEILDPRYDWPLSTTALRAYVTDKYGAGNEYAVHHYVNSDGDTVHSSYAGIKTAIANYDYEDGLNEAKRQIRLIKPEFMNDFVTNFTGILSNG